MRKVNFWLIALAIWEANLWASAKCEEDNSVDDIKVACDCEDESSWTTERLPIETLKQIYEEE